MQVIINNNATCGLIVTDKLYSYHGRAGSAESGRGSDKEGERHRRRRERVMFYSYSRLLNNTLRDNANQIELCS
jgi:hypothetical protein